MRNFIRLAVILLCVGLMAVTGRTVMAACNGVSWAFGNAQGAGNDGVFVCVAKEGSDITIFVENESGTSLEVVGVHTVGDNRTLSARWRGVGEFCSDNPDSSPTIGVTITHSGGEWSLPQISCTDLERVNIPQEDVRGDTVVGSPTPDGCSVTALGSYVNVRSGAGTNFPKIGVLPRGRYAPIIVVGLAGSDQEGWVIITPLGTEHAFGYVHINYIDTANC